MTAALYRRRRPWFVPAGIVGAAILALVASGVIPLGLLTYLVPLAGCGLMHVFMGHGGHGAHGDHEPQASATEEPSRATGDATGHD